jgi:hypothetical protein
LTERLTRAIAVTPYISGKFGLSGTLAEQLLGLGSIARR